MTIYTTESRSRMTNRLFLDTSYAIALATPTDQYHDCAVHLSREIEKKATKLLTTRPILLEIGNSVARRDKRKSGGELLLQITTDPNILIVELTKSLYERAFDLFLKYGDKEWGLVDCVSFVVMNERNVQLALTTDNHFVQAGFRALLREL